MIQAILVSVAFYLICGVAVAHVLSDTIEDAVKRDGDDAVAFVSAMAVFVWPWLFVAAVIDLWSNSRRWW